MAMLFILNGRIREKFININRLLTLPMNKETLIALLLSLLALSTLYYKETNRVDQF